MKTAAKQELRPIGVIRSTLTDRSAAPRQGDEGAPDAWLEVEPWAAAALHRIAVGDALIVITWFRPNPLGLHPVTVREISGTRLRIGPIEAIDGTPVVDIKSG